MALPILTKYRGMELTVLVSAMEMLENEGKHTIYSVEVYNSESKSDMPIGASQQPLLSEAIAEAFSTLALN